MTLCWLVKEGIPPFIFKSDAILTPLLFNC